MSKYLHLLVVLSYIYNHNNSKNIVKNSNLKKCCIDNFAVIIASLKLNIKSFYYYPALLNRIRIGKSILYQGFFYYLALLNRFRIGKSMPNQDFTITLHC